MYLFIQSRYSRLYQAEKFYPISPKTYNETPQFQRKSVLCKQINNILLCSPIENANIKTYYFFFFLGYSESEQHFSIENFQMHTMFFLSYVIIFFSKFWSSLKNPLGSSRNSLLDISHMNVLSLGGATIHQTNVASR